MNILLSNSTDIFAGGEDYVLILAKYLRRRGHAVWVSANPGHLLLQKCEAAGVPTVPLSFRGMSRVFAAARHLRKELDRRSVAVVHSNANYDRTCAALACAGTRTRHVASVHSAHSIQHNVTHWLRNRFAIDHFIADAESVKHVLVHQDKLPASRVTVIPIGVESDTQEFRARARTQARAKLGVHPETIVIGNVARLVPFKGHSYLLQAVAEVVQAHRNVLFPIIGDGDLMSTLRHQSEQLGIDDVVRFLGFQDKLNELYPSFDIYCHSSLEMAAEAFPLAILRALAAGLPVVCTNVGGISLMVEEGVSGFLVPPEDLPALARALKKLIAEPTLRTTMGEASQNLFVRRFHAATMAENVERVYASVFQQGR